MQRCARSDRGSPIAVSKPASGLTKDRIRKVLARVGFMNCQFFENSVDSDGEGTHCFLALEEDNYRSTQSWLSSHFAGTDKDDPTDWVRDFNPWPESWKQQQSKVDSGPVAGSRGNLN
jgi:hypothetical protein